MERPLSEAQGMVSQSELQLVDPTCILFCSLFFYLFGTDFSRPTFRRFGNSGGAQGSSPTEKGRYRVGQNPVKTSYLDADRRAGHELRPAGGSGDGEGAAGTRRVGDAAKVALGADADGVVLIGQLAAVEVVVIERPDRARHARVVLQAAVVRCDRNDAVQLLAQLTSFEL